MCHLAQKIRYALTLALLLAILIATTAVAADRVIDTTDGLVDPDWQAIPFSSDALGDSGPGGDIETAWVASDSATSELAFRLHTNGALNESYYIYARIDCNGDGISYTQPNDIIVMYFPSSDMLYEFSGDQNAMDSLPADQGEAIAGADFEWKVVRADSGNVFWSTCSPLPWIKFEVIDSNRLNVVDDTAARGFNVPTAVTLASLQARPQVDPLAAALLPLLGGAFTGAGLLLWLRRRSLS